jgi:ABC-type dipeptide/oligopeptide/nickel transport system permease component
MNPILRVLFGIVVMVMGYFIVMKSETVFSWFGRIDWAEEKLGAGQSRLFYKLVGILVAFTGIFIATNIISDILSGFTGIFVR